MYLKSWFVLQLFVMKFEFWREIHLQKNTLPVDNITTQIRNEVMKIPAVKEITQIRVFGPGMFLIAFHNKQNLIQLIYILFVMISLLSVK